MGKQSRLKRLKRATEQGSALASDVPTLEATLNELSPKELRRLGRELGKLPEYVAPPPRYATRDGTPVNHAERRRMLAMRGKQ
jgi:hypothetical protein